MNFVLQRQSFAPGAGLHAALVKRYLMAEALIVTIQQGLFVTLLETRPYLACLSSEEAWQLGALRMVSQAGVFFAVSFPLRKNWVFAASELPFHAARPSQILKMRGMP
ncbi:unnamed protein product [Effrenium voratum]|nr:unnamed protein product [Effrenium voratum]